MTRELFSGASALALGAADLRHAGIFVICLILAISVHEFSHAFCAARLGDPTPEHQGRLTLNPIVHADPVGTLALPIMLALWSPGFFFGWGRPVETQPRYYTRKISMRGGMALVAFAGPLSNVLLAAVTLLITWLVSMAGVLGQELFDVLSLFFMLNIFLFLFNMLPVHPLDGGKILAFFLPAKYQHVDEFLARYGFVVILALVFAGGPILSAIFGPVMKFGTWLLQAVV